MDLFSSVFSSTDTNLFYSAAHSSFSVCTKGTPPVLRLGFGPTIVHYVMHNWGIFLYLIFAMPSKTGHKEAFCDGFASFSSLRCSF